MHQQLGPEEAASILSEGHIGNLGCITERGPYVVPVSYIFHDGDVYIHSRMGDKIRALRHNPLVCLQVGDMQGVYHWRSAIAFGKYEEVTDPDERYSFNRRILLRFPYLTPVESLSFESKEQEVIIFRIRVEKITAICERQQGENKK
jgi:uncharacterized protein